MTDTTAVGGDLIRRLKKQAYFMCVSCNEAPYPEERQCWPAPELRLVDGEPWCEICYGDSGEFPEIRWRDRPVFDPLTELVEAAKAESADALEAAVEVIERMKQACLFADDDGGIGVTNDPHIDERLFDEICDWLNRHVNRK